MHPSVSSSDRVRVERAVRYIAEHLDGPLTVAEVARAAHLSEFHFHRTFSAVTGESVGRFITRRRLELAALRLAYERERSITEIAMDSGYSSPSNFAKAFSAFFGCSPSRVRNPGGALPRAVGKLTRTYGKDFDPAALYAVPPGLSEEETRRVAAYWSSRVRFEDTPGFDVLCLRSEAGYQIESLVELFAELIARARQLGLCGEDVDAWGIAHDSPRLTAPSLCRYDACVRGPVPPGVAPPLFVTRIPAGRYAVFGYEGPTEGVEAMYRAIYSAWLPVSSLAPDDFTVVEHHTGDGPRDGRVELESWIKVRPR